MFNLRFTNYQCLFRTMFLFCLLCFFSPSSNCWKAINGWMFNVQVIRFRCKNHKWWRWNQELISLTASVNIQYSVYRDIIRNQTKPFPKWTIVYSIWQNNRILKNHELIENEIINLFISRQSAKQVFDYLSDVCCVCGVRSTISCLWKVKTENKNKNAMIFFLQ